MNTFTLPQSANWTNHSLSVNSTGSMCVYASKLNIVVVKNADKLNVYEFDINIIQKAHKSRVCGVVFCQFVKEGNSYEYFASCGEDNLIHVWDPQTLSLIYVCNLSNSNNKMVDLDGFNHSGVVVTVCDNGSIIKYNMIINKVSVYDIGIKITGINCISACPHDTNLVAIGADYGLVVVYSLKDDGKLIHKIRPHNFNVLSLSWCPVPYNVLQLECLRNEPNFDEESWKQSDCSLLLASCSVDRTIYICKAGTNAYCETIISLPSKPLRYLAKTNFNAQNYEKVCRIIWAQPLLLLATTEFNELVAITFRKDGSSRNKHPRQRREQSNSMVTYDISLLHNQHRRFISCLNVPSLSAANLIPVWTVSLDKIIIRYSYGSKQTKTLLNLPTISGPVYCLAFSPVNPDILAVGTGESKIYIWYVTAKNHLDIMVLSKKIQDKVMSIVWHPVYEGLLAFGTTGGRIGIFDISQGQNFPILLKPYHSRAIYKLSWIPCTNNNNSDADKYNLWALGNGDVLQYNIDKPSELPIDMKGAFGEADANDKCTPKTEMCYNADGDIFVFGLDDGRLFVASRDKEYKMRHIVWDQRRAVMSMAFHPKVITSSPDEISTYKNWLAVGGENVIIYDVDTDCKNPPRKIAFHDIHLEKVTEICWSPHVNGRLLSVSFDFTAVIWNAISQTVIASYHLHKAAIFCCVWHPFDQNLAITGSHDGTCRVWHIFNDTYDKVPSKEEVKEKIKIRRKPVMPICVKESTREVTSITTIPGVSCNTNGTGSTKKTQWRTLFPISGKYFQKSRNLDSVIQKSINDYINGDKLTNGVVAISEKNEVTKDDESDVTYANLFGTDDELEKLIKVEESELASSVITNSFVLTQSRFGLKEKILDAMQKNEVTEYMLTMAPAISPKLWRDACNVYIEQLISADHILQAVNFMLALNKHKEAISLLCEKRFYKEAFLICRQCLKDDSEVKDVAVKLAEYSATTGFSRLAAHAYMFIGDHSTAANTLIRSKTITDVSLGIKLMYHINSTRATELSMDCFRKLVVSRAWIDIASLLQQVDTIKYLEPWHLVAKYLHGNKMSTRVITDWFMGNVDDNPSLKFLKQAITNSDTDFSKLERSVPDNTFNMDGRQLLMHTSGHLALFLIGWKENEKRTPALRHLLKALSYCYNYRIVNASTNRNTFYPMLKIFMIIFPKGPLNIDQNCDELLLRDAACTDLAHSVLAYLGDCVICWLIRLKCTSQTATTDNRNNDDDKKIIGDNDRIESDNESIINENETDDDDDDKRSITNEVKSEKLRILFEKFLDDVLNIRNVMYYQSTTLLKSIEMHVSTNLDIDDVLNDRVRIIDLIINDYYYADNKNIDDTDTNNTNTNLDSIIDRISIENLKLNIDRQLIIEKPSTLNLIDVKHPRVNNLLKYVKEFEEKYASSPNPIYFYGQIRDYLAGIANDEDKTAKQRLADELAMRKSKFNLLF